MFHNIEDEQDKTPNVGAGEPPSKILVDGVPVEGAEEFIYPGSKQSSISYCRPDVLTSTQDWTCLFSEEQASHNVCMQFHTDGMELQFAQYHHQSTPVPSTDKVHSALT